MPLPMPLPEPLPMPPPLSGADLERRFGGLRRLYGDTGYARIRAARIAVVGLGGVGSWSCEALARSGVAALTLIDLDHVAESNINRQVQATSTTLGQAKALALRDRIATIHPGCAVVAVEEFVDETNWPGLLRHPIDVLIDACDQVRAKAALAAWALRTGTALVVVGAAGGKRQPQAVRVSDLSQVTHDPLLAALRQRLRKQYGAARAGLMGVRCIHSLEPVAAPAIPVCAVEGNAAGESTDRSDSSDSRDSRDSRDSGDGSLNCHGYGSSVSVTATFGLVAANEALEFVAV